ncbi:hypothetical protein GR925_30595 [Streptomyces sp. HUCO-GS316]|uniref:hypothetical protein n=1 Tax=Streptomyces sp. HUCO-GS316 TaxID=2692198 RepID=UPI00136BAE33|nr:hypothetical protein [Streptomyces sp. HUCO-GS316]MXM67669.1 hypothetical protein [Streptomyces sp. HUCO-GS316]
MSTLGRLFPGRPAALLRRRRAAGQERAMPRRLRQDLERALAEDDDAARRTAVDRVVRGITEGTYGRGFQERAAHAADRSRPDDHRASLDHLPPSSRVAGRPVGGGD